MRVDAIEDDGQAGGEQQAQRSGGVDEPDGELLRVAGFDQHGQQQAAQRHDGDAGAGPGEDGANHRGGDGEAPGHPAEQRIVDPQQAAVGAPFHQKVAGEGEQRKRRQDGRGDQSVGGHGDGSGGDSVAPEQQQGQAAQGGEDGEAQGGGGQDDDGAADHDRRAGQVRNEAERHWNQQAHGREHTRRSVPHQPQGDQQEAHRHDALRHPLGNAGSENRTAAALGEHEIEAGPGQAQRNGCGHGCGERAGVGEPGFRQKGVGGHGQQPVRARRDGRSEQRHPKGEVLDEDGRAGDAEDAELARGDLGEGQKGHQRNRGDSDRVFGFLENPGGAERHLVLTRARYSSRRRTTSSNRSAATMSPRSLG